MAIASQTDVEIDGETFDLVAVPNAKTKMVQNAKGALLGSLDLASLVDDLGKLGNFIRVAYNGVAGNTEIQIKVQKVGYKITNLADKSAVTVHNFKRASQNVLQELQGTYQFLLDGMEEMAIETLSLLTSVAKDMAEAANELHNDFEKATTDVIDALEDTQRAKGTQEEKKKTLEEERREFEMQKLKAEELQKSALEAEEKAKAFYYEAQAREDKAMDAQDSLIGALSSAFTGVMKAATAAAKLDMEKATEALEKIGDKSGYKDAMKMANEEKKRQMEKMDEQRQIRQDALLQCIEFTEKIKNCKDDDALADAAIEALHSSIGALKSLSAIMMNAALFWQQMQTHCENLAKEDVQQLVEKAMEYPEEKRLKVWTSKAFKTRAVQYYSKWVALDDVCEVYMLQIKDTRKDLYSYLEENPTIEQAKKNVRQLAETFAADLKKAQDKLEEKQQKALEEKKSLRTLNELESLRH
ncbi:hypothetical protein ACROYT_G003713 [Oculina patagonica]